MLGETSNAESARAKRWITDRRVIRGSRARITRQISSQRGVSAPLLRLIKAGMEVRMTQGEANIVRNLRAQCGEAIAKYSDEAIAKAWREFSCSDEYPDMEKFPLWIEEG